MSNKKKVVFTAAVMDLFHEGHKNLLNKMREEAGEDGLVIVVLHDDYSTFLNKKRFPVQSLEHRAKNLVSTSLADNVFKAYQIEPIDVFKIIIEGYSSVKYELTFMRGDDWQDFPGRAFLEKRNIAIKLIPYTKGISSSIRRKKEINIRLIN